MFGFDGDMKTIRIPVRFVGSGMVLADGRPLPPISDGASGELRLYDYAVADGDIKRECQAGVAIPMLESGTSVYFRVMTHRIPAERWKEIEQKKRLAETPEGLCAEVHLKEELKLCLRGSKTPTLYGCKCTIPCLDNKEAISLNHAYTLISSHFETERASHTGNVFKHGWWYDGQQKQWVQLDELRTITQSRRQSDGRTGDHLESMARL